MRINKLLVTSMLFLAFPSFVFGQVGVTPAIQYQFTNNLNTRLIIETVSGKTAFKDMPSVIYSKKTVTLSVFGFANQNPTIIMSRPKHKAIGSVDYRFSFLPQIPSSMFSGESFFNDLAFSWSQDNLHIFLCSNKDYEKHKSCNY